MQEIKCPKCGEVFLVDESGYAQIVQQIRDKEFEKELKRREESIEVKKNSDLEIIRMQQEQEISKMLLDKQMELSKKDNEIKELEGKLENSETEKKLAVSSAVQKKEQEISDKNNEIIRLQGKLSIKEKESKIKEENLQKQYENGFPVSVSPYDTYCINGHSTGGTINLAAGRSSSYSDDLFAQSTTAQVKTIIAYLEFQDGTEWNNPYLHEWIIGNCSTY